MARARKWDLESCKKESLKFGSRTGWAKGSESSYKAALKNEWMKACCKHMKKRNSWNKKSCAKEARKYKTRSSFNKGSYGAYKAALVNGWLDFCCEHMKKTGKEGDKVPQPRRYLITLDKCKSDALPFKTRTEWARKKSSTYQAARKNDWLDDCCKHMDNRANAASL